VVGRRRRKTRSLGAGAILLGLAAGISMLSADPAHAQGLFDAVSKFFGASSPARAPETARAPDQPPMGYADPFGLLTPEPAQEPNEAGPVVAYCVRLCDGRYFPLPRNAGAPHSSPDKICSAMCPASPTKVYSGSQIDQASASNGTRYSNIKNAFVYRERMVPGCSCTGKDGTGTAAIDIHSDPTLRSGDIVVTKDGPMVFKGGRTPHQLSDFTLVKSYSGLPADLRRQVSEMKVAPKVNSAADESVGSSAPTRTASTTAPSGASIASASTAPRAVLGTKPRAVPVSAPGWSAQPNPASDWRTVAPGWSALPSADRMPMLNMVSTIGTSSTP